MTDRSVHLTGLILISQLLLGQAAMIPAGGQSHVTELEGSVSYAQAVDRAYGLDQELINGTQYYNRYLMARGNPYFMDGSFQKGMVSVNGSVYPDVNLQYDIYSQHLELRYESFSGANNHLVMVTGHLDSFRIGTLRFERLELEGEMRICQVIRTEPFTCYIHWTKQLFPASNIPAYSSQFTDSHCSYLLEMEGTRHRFRNRRTFVSLFPQVPGKEIRKLLRKHGVSFRRNTPGTLSPMMEDLAGYLVRDQSGPGL